MLCIQCILNERAIFNILMQFFPLYLEMCSNVSTVVVVVLCQDLKDSIQEHCNVEIYSTKMAT